MARQRLALLWILFVLVATGTQLAFKWGAAPLENLDFGLEYLLVALSTPAVWLALIGYAGNFVLWMQILQRMELSRAFPMTGLMYITVPAGAYVLFGESLDRAGYLGVALIIAGIVTLARDQES